MHRLALEELTERLMMMRRVPDVLDYKFPQQVEFIKDPSHKKALWCTRRSAKSYTAGLGLHRTALQFPGCNCLFIGLTRESAHAIIWKDILTAITNKHGLEVHPNQTNLTVTHKNGSVIKVLGVDKDEEEMYKLLGRKFKLVVIDEASMYTISISNLIDLIEPATIDQGGQIWLMGTSSNFPRGIFYDITQAKKKDWKLFQWTAHDNPYVAKQWQAKLEEIARDRPEYMETPQFKQWYLNRWEVDEEKLVYRFEMAKNLARDLPHLGTSDWIYVLGVDTGWEDDSAFVLTAYHVHHPILYIISSFKKKKMTFDDVVIKIQNYMDDKQYAPHKVIIDGANKQGVESMRQRSSIPFEYADKRDKVTFIELCNSDLIQGKIKILDNPANRSLWEELAALVWVTEADKIKYPKKEHPSLPNHLCFIAGTKIRTADGEIDIESLRVGDKVETRYGQRRIKNTIKRNANVIKLQMSNGSTVTCTADHPFWSKDRWIKARDLTPMDQLFTWSQLQSQKESNLKGSTSIDLSNLNISEQSMMENLFDYIKRYGSIIVGRFLKIITFITKIIMPLIIAWRTLSVFLRKNTNLITCAKDLKQQKISSILKRSDRLQSRGIDPKLGEFGIEITGGKQSNSLMQIVHGATQFIPSLICTRIVMDAAHNDALPQNEEPAESMILNLPAHGANQDLLQINMQNENVVVCVAQDLSKRTECVYNLTIEDDHEYFANGFLVANCDAFLYAWRCGWHYASIAPTKKITLYSREWYQAQSESLWERERENIERKSGWSEEGSLGELG